MVEPKDQYHYRFSSFFQSFGMAEPKIIIIIFFLFFPN